jgi:Fe-S cluster assembly protein SufD
LNDEKHKEVFEKYFNTITHEDNPFADLNLAYCKYGFFLHVPKNTVIEKPIHVFYFLKIRKKTRSTIQEIY